MLQGSESTSEGTKHQGGVGSGDGDVYNPTTGQESAKPVKPVMPDRGSSEEGSRSTAVNIRKDCLAPPHSGDSWA